MVRLKRILPQWQARIETAQAECRRVATNLRITAGAHEANESRTADSLSGLLTPADPIAGSLLADTISTRPTAADPLAGSVVGNGFSTQPAAADPIARSVVSGAPASDVTGDFG
ncbi:hypothetical protein ACFPK5_15605 [Streptomyces beijiangensis]